MSEIKKGALVKAFGVKNPELYIIGRYQFFDDGGIFHVVESNGVCAGFIKAIEIPPELASQLEALGGDRE